MISIENKCTLVSFADALAYQYPEKLANVNVHSPGVFVQLVLGEYNLCSWPIATNFECY